MRALCINLLLSDCQVVLNPLLRPGLINSSVVPSCSSSPGQADAILVESFPSGVVSGGSASFFARVDSSKHYTCI